MMTMTTMDNSILFFKVWRNIVIFKIIKSYLRMFNLNSGYMSIHGSNIKKFKKYQYKQYIQTLHIDNDCYSKISDKEERIENLKSLYTQILNECIHLKELSIYNTNTQNEPMKLKLISIFTGETSSSSLTVLGLNGTTYNGKINCNTFPKSLTNLKLPRKFSHAIKANVLPSNLKYLSIGSEYKLTLEPGVLPITLEKLTFENNIDVPFSIDSLSYLINLVEVIFTRPISQSFPNGVFPNSITNLQFQSGICKTQQLDREWLPNNLQSLSIGGQNKYTFNDNSFPVSLTSISLLNSFYSTITHLPDSIKTLKNHSSRLSMEYIKNELTTHPRVYQLLLDSEESNKLDLLLQIPVIFEANTEFYDKCEDSWSKLLKFQKLPTIITTTDNNLKIEKKKSSFINLYDQIEFLCIGMQSWFNRSTFSRLIFPHSIRVLIVANGYYLNHDSNGNMGGRPIKLPSNLEILSIELGPGQCISTLEIPASLQVLSVNTYSQPIAIQYIPNQLKTLFIRGFRYRDPSLLAGNIDDLPQSLRSIYFVEDLSYSTNFYYPTHHHLFFKVTQGNLTRLFNKLVKDTLYL